MEKRLGRRNLLAVGVWRTALGGADKKFFPKSDFDEWDSRKPFPLSNWTLEVDCHFMLSQKKFALSIFHGYGFEWGNSWYLGGSMHLGFNASYPLTPRLRFTLVAGSRFMHLLENQDGYSPYSPSIVGYANAGIKWIFNESKTDATGIGKYISKLRPSRKLGIGFVCDIGNGRAEITFDGGFPEPYIIVGIEGGSLINNDLLEELNMPHKSYKPYSFPYLQFTRATPKLHFHSIGLGFRKTFVDYSTGNSQIPYSYDYKINNYRFYYQYDVPLLKTKTSSALLYTGVNCSLNIQDFESGTYNGDEYSGSYSVHHLIPFLPSPH